MISYELAKELKEAGFPQTTEFYHEESEYVDNQRYHRPHSLYGIRRGDTPSAEQSLIADPSLEELIEAIKKFQIKFALGVGTTGACVAYTEPASHSFLDKDPGVVMAKLYLSLKNI